MSKRKLSLRRLFSNTKFLIVFSIAVAFIFWIVVALQYAPIVENTIKDVPVQIELENSVPDKMGLQLFGKKDFTVDVTVSGSRYIVGGELLKADDFEVTAQTAYVNSAGNYMLQLKVTAKNPDSDFDIVSLSEDYIDVYFDKTEEKDITVKPRIITDLSKLTDNEYLFNEDEIIYSVNTVHLKGAKTEIDKISEGYLDIKIDEKLKETVSTEADISLDNGTDDDVRYVTVNGAESMSVPVTLPVYKIQTLPASVTFKNAPSDYVSNPLEYSCIPASVKVAVLQNGSEYESVSVGTIDYSQITPVFNNFKFKADEIENVKILDGTKAFIVKVNTAGLTAVTLEPDATNIVFTNNAQGAEASVDLSKTGKITVVGRASQLAEITSEDIIGNVDAELSKLGKSASDVPVSFSLKKSSSCWIAGEYSANVTVK